MRGRDAAAADRALSRVGCIGGGKTAGSVRAYAEREFTGPGDAPELFERIARCYDGMNRLLSLGRDRHWRKLAADTLRLPSGGCALDVGTGTGDMALAATRRWPDAIVVGLDPTASMIDVARQKPETERIWWTQADGLHLPFPDRAFDGVVSAFLLRNVVDVPQALTEQSRLVRDGGRVVCLELSWPQTPIFSALFRLYFADLLPRIAGLLSGEPAAYRYLPRSVQRFLTPSELTETMEEIGLRNVRCHRLALGTVTLHVGEGDMRGRTC